MFCIKHYSKHFGNLERTVLTGIISLVAKNSKSYEKNYYNVVHRNCKNVHLGSEPQPPIHPKGKLHVCMRFLHGRDPDICIGNHSVMRHSCVQ